MVPRTRVALLLFCSGLCALTYQITWFRSLRLVFGASTAANAAVLAIFMGGLGLGGLLLGRRADRHPMPLRMYANLELGIALLAAASPYLVDLVRAGYIATGGTAALGGFFGTLVRLTGATLVLGGPVVLMGGTLPAAVRACQTDADAHRSSMALLYGANTIGSVAGALLGTFYLTEILGVRSTLLAAACINGVVAMTARAMAARAGTVDPDPPAPAGAPPEPAGAPPRAPAAFVVAAAGVVGFAFLLMELVFYRMLGPILGGSSYTFGMILGCALLGIGIGGLLYARRDGTQPVTARLFAVTCIAEALALGIPLALGDDLALLALFSRPLENFGFGGLVLSWLGINAIVVLPGAIVAGYQFPLLVALLGSGRSRVGREVGLAYAWNTLGAIAGSLAGGFGLLPALGAVGAWRMVVVVLLLAGAGALIVAGRDALSRGGALAALLGAMAAACVLAPGPGAVWRHAGIGAGRAPSRFESAVHLEDWRRQQHADLLWEVDGTESSVALFGRDGYAFVINGKVDGNARADAPTQVMLGVLGAVLHPDAKTGFVIGLGTGASAGWLGAIPTTEEVDVVELEEAIVKVAGMCRHANEDVLDNDKVRIVIGDAREVLPTTRKKYDLVVSEPSNPYRAGIASLFTREYYETVSDRLEDDGLFLQWVQAYEVDARTMRIIYATLGSVFPHVETWESSLGEDLVLVAARHPIVHDLRRIGKRLEEPVVRRALVHAWGVTGVPGLFTGHVANAGFGKALAAENEGDICTDDNALVEFGFARSVGRTGLFGADDIRREAHERGYAAPIVTGGTIDQEMVDELWMARVAAEGHTEAVRKVRSAGGMARQSARAAFARGQVDRALAEWRAQAQKPENLTDLTMLAEGLAYAGDRLALEHIEALEPASPVTARALRGVWLARTGALEAGKSTLVEAFHAYRSDPWPLPSLMLRALVFAEGLTAADGSFGLVLADALAEPFAAGALGRNRTLARVRIGLEVAGEGCVELLESIEPHVPFHVQILTARVRCYEAAGHELAARARGDLEAFVAASPPRLFPAGP